MYFVKVGSVTWALVGDIAFSRQDIIENRPKPWAYSHLLVPEAPDRLAELRGWLNAFASDANHRIVVSHALDELERSGSHDGIAGATGRRVMKIDTNVMRRSALPVSARPNCWRFYELVSRSGAGGYVSPMVAAAVGFVLAFAAVVHFGWTGASGARLGSCAGVVALLIAVLTYGVFTHVPIEGAREFGDGTRFLVGSCWPVWRCMSWDRSFKRFSVPDVLRFRIRRCSRTVGQTPTSALSAASFSVQSGSFLGFGLRCSQ
jgi:hypothetical protein